MTNKDNDRQPGQGRSGRKADLTPASIREQPTTVNLSPATAALAGAGGSRLNEGQSRALTALRSGRNVLLTGPAGTGKSFVLQEWLPGLPRGFAAIKAAQDVIDHYLDTIPAVRLASEVLRGHAADETTREIMRLSEALARKRAGDTRPDHRGRETMSVYRAAIWVSADRQREVVLTGTEQSDLGDEDLIRAGEGEADRLGLDLADGEIIAADWEDGGTVDTTVSANDIEWYLGDAAPRDFDSVEEITAYFNDESLACMLASVFPDVPYDAAHAGRVRREVIRQWRQAGGWEAEAAEAVYWAVFHIVGDVELPTTGELTGAIATACERVCRRMLAEARGA